MAKFHATADPYIVSRVRALESLLMEKGLLPPGMVDAVVARFENDTGPMLGARLVAAFDSKLLITWQESARVQACFTQINNIAYSLNAIQKNAGEEAAARELLARSSEILAAFKEFRTQIMPDGEA